MATLPTDYLDLFETNAIAHLGVALRDGSVAVYPVWCGYDGETVHFVSSKTSAKYRVIQRNPRVTLCLSDPRNPYRYLEIRGSVTRIDEEGGDALLDALAHRYTGVKAYPDRSQQGNRAIFRLVPENVKGFTSKLFP